MVPFESAARGADRSGRETALGATPLVGHATLRIVTEQYDSFLDPASWPSGEEVERLRAFYGWTAGQSLPRPSLESPRDTRMQKTPPSQHCDGARVVEHETGLEPATPTLAKRRGTKK